MVLDAFSARPVELTGDAGAAGAIAGPRTETGQFVTDATGLIRR